MYRPFPYAIRVTDSSDIRFRNVHVDSNSQGPYCPASGDCRQYVRSSKFSYGTCILDPDARTPEVRDREFAFLNLTGVRAHRPPRPALRRCSSPGAKVEKLATRLLQHLGRRGGRRRTPLLRRSALAPHLPLVAETKKLTIVRDNPLDPVNLVFDKAGNLIVVSNGGSTAWPSTPSGLTGPRTRSRCWSASLRPSVRA